MTQSESSSPSSQPESEKRTSKKTDPATERKIEEAKEYLTKHGVKWDRLLICMLGGAECIVGEWVTLEENPEFSVEFLSESLLLKSPKRIIRQQERRGHGVSMTFVLTDLDLIDEGYMETRPLGVTAVRWLGGESLLSYLGLYVQYLHLKSLEHSNIALPTGPGGLVQPGSDSFIHPHLRGPRG